MLAVDDWFAGNLPSWLAAGVGLLAAILVWRTRPRPASYIELHHHSLAITYEKRDSRFHVNFRARLIGPGAYVSAGGQLVFVRAGRAAPFRRRLARYSRLRLGLRSFDLGLAEDPQSHTRIPDTMVFHLESDVTADLAPDEKGQGLIDIKVQASDGSSRRFRACFELAEVDEVPIADA